MLRSFFIQLVIFITIFQLMSWIRATSMLPTDEVTSTTSAVLPTIMNEVVSIKAANKNKIIYFFAPWCQVCHASISNLQAIYEKNSDVDVIAIALDYEDVNEVKRFTQQHKLTFPVALGNEETKKKYKVQGYPSYYVVNKDNIVQAKSIGYTTELGLYLRSL